MVVNTDSKIKLGEKMRFTIFLVVGLISTLAVSASLAAPKKQCFPLPNGWGGVFPSAKIVTADGKKIWRAVVPKNAGNGRKAEFYRSCWRHNCNDVPISGYLCKGMLGTEQK